MRTKRILEEEEKIAFQQLVPGTKNWFDYWKKHPSEQKDMIALLEQCKTADWWIRGLCTILQDSADELKEEVLNN